MRAEEAVAHARGQTGGDRGDRQAGGIGGEDRMRAEMRQNASSAAPVLISRFSVTASITQSHPASFGRSSSKLPGVMSVASDGSKKAAGLRFGKSGRGGLSEPLALRASGLWSEVEQKDGDSGIGQVCGDARAHGSGAEHGGAAHQQRFGDQGRGGSCGRGGSAHASSQYSILLGEAIQAAKLAQASSPSNCVEGSLRWP